MNKDDWITRMMAELKTRLGVETFRVADHWEGDLHAIGIADPQDENRLAYVAAMGSNRFFVEIESAALIGKESPYSVAETFQSVTIEQLAALVANHFRLAAAQSHGPLQATVEPEFQNPVPQDRSI